MLLDKIKDFFVLAYKLVMAKPIHYCNCVCHSPASSRAWCEHCNGTNAVSEDKKKRDYAKFIARENIQEWAANQKHYQMKRKGKNVSLECPHCKTKLRIYAYNSNACICLKCKQPFDLSEAHNLTVINDG